VSGIADGALKMCSKSGIVTTLGKLVLVDPLADTKHGSPHDYSQKPSQGKGNANPFPVGQISHFNSVIVR
jgi:hypothetical protein